MQSNGASTRGACPSSPLLIMSQSRAYLHISSVRRDTKCNCAYWPNKLPHTHAIVLIGQMQLQKVFHNLDFLQCESINAISAIVLLTHYVQSSPGRGLCTGVATAGACFSNFPTFQLSTIWKWRSTDLEVLVHFQIVERRSLGNLENLENIPNFLNFFRGLERPKATSYAVRKCYQKMAFFIWDQKSASYAIRKGLF